MKRRIHLCLALLATAVLVIGCGRGQDSDRPAKPRIALVMKSLGKGFALQVAAGQAAPPDDQTPAALIAPGRWRAT